MRSFLITACCLFFKYGFAQTPSYDLHAEVKSSVSSGEYDRALSLLENNIATVRNDTSGLFDALINLYLFEKQWRDIVNVYSIHEFRSGEDTTVLSIARFCSQHPEEKIQLDQSVHIPFKAGATGTPVIDVKVNGHDYHFWFDTGAGMTVISSATAAACGIKQADSKNGVAVAATGKSVDLDPGVIDSLKISNMKVFNHACIILNKKDLEIKVLGIPILKIDGIIGWNLLQELEVTINNQSGMISLASPKSYKRNDHNFFWFGQPIVTGSDSTGASFLFVMDTGSGRAGIYEPFLSRSDTFNLKKKVIMMGSAGGMKKTKSFVFPLLKFNVGGQLVELRNVSVFPYRQDNLFLCDGVLGINEFKKRTINFNVRSGFFTVTN